MANHTFTQPIRYYKANDPYYYEVDNIPLRQLEENILYVKGLIEGATGGGSGDPGSEILTGNSELNLSNIKQLRPKTSGGRRVTVNAGIFNSRVNDAFDIAKPLTRLFNIFTGPGDTTGANANTTVIRDIYQSFGFRDTVWDAFTGTAAAANSYNINGLEFAYTFHSTPGGVTSNWGVTTTAGTGEGSENYPKYDGVDPSVQGVWPGYSKFGPLGGQVLRTAPGAGNLAIRWTSENLPDIHQAFVKMWRGVFRTTVVDFPESSIDIPVWNDEDFYYYDENDNKVTINADQRIDLLVAYSVSIDSSGTALQDYEDGFGNTGSTPTPKKITKPVLGLYKGAGVGIKKDDNVSPNIIRTTEGLAPDTPPAGSARMVGNASDYLDESIQGITAPDGTKVYGSFPTPDDLLNLAPVIALGLDSDDLQLVGQAALPLAYIVVKKGQTNLTQNDIIDIRPFLRTAELTYNERAGVAAANPPLSFANPAVGAYTLQRVVDGIETNIANMPGGEPDGQALYTDYVMGGLAFGPEGTLLTMCDYPQTNTDPFGSISQNATYVNRFDPNESYTFAEFNSSKAFMESYDSAKKQAFLQYLYEQRQGSLKRWLSDPNTPGLSDQSESLSYLDLPAGSEGRNIALLPEWDLPVEATNYANFFSTTPKVSWWMHFEAQSYHRGLVYAPGGVAAAEFTGSNNRNYLDRLFGFGMGNIRANAGFNVCSKKLQITLPPWCNDYDVIVEYTNCAPLTSMGNASDLAQNCGTGGGLFVNKGPIVTNAANGTKSAVFQINSMADNLRNIDTGAVNNAAENSIVGEQGQILDRVSGDRENANSHRESLFLSYSVVLPQFRQTKFDMEGQTVPIANLNRFAPKTGAAYYPTVKFTIIGYKSKTFTRNAAFNTNSDYTLTQQWINGEAHPGNLLGAQAPVQSQSQPSLVDLKDLT